MNDEAPSSRDLTQGPLWRRCLTFGSLLAVGMMGHGFFNLVDLVIVGRVGSGAIASVTISGMVLTVVMLVFDGMTNIAVALTSQAHASGRRDVVHDVAWESFWLTVGAGVVTGLLFYFLAAPTVGSFGFQDPQTIDDAVEYFQIMALGNFTMFLIMQSTAVLRGVGDAFWAMVILVGSNVLNIFLDIALVFGYWGFPEMGVAGAAWATVISRGVGGLLGLWLIWEGVVEGVCMRAYPFRKRFRHLRTICLVGLPTSLQLSVRVFSVFLLLKIAEAAYVGSSEAFVDGVGVATRLEMVAVFMGLGWGSAGTAIVGQNLGSRRVRRAHASAWILVGYAVVTMGLSGALIWLFRFQLFDVLGPLMAPEAVVAGIDYLRITIPFYPAMAVSFVICRALNGAGSTKTPMVIDFVLFILVMMPLAAWACGLGVFGYGEEAATTPLGAWWATVGVHAVAAAAYVFVWRRGHWRRKRLGTLLPEDAQPV